VITAVELRAAINTLLKKHFPAYKVHFDNVERANQSYFYVWLSPRSKTIDRVYYDRTIDIDIQLVLLKDCKGRVKRSLLYDAIDKLDVALRPVLQIGDRFITISSTNSVIVDEILHYEFSLDFTDVLPVEEVGELMQELYLNGNLQDLNYEEV